MKPWGVRVLFAALLGCAAAPAQRDLAAWPDDALRAAAKLPVADAVGGGVRVLVRTGGRPAVAEANVFVVDPTAVDAGTLAFLQAAYGRDRHLVLASVHGTRYRTGADGTVCVALPPNGVVVACEGGAMGFAVAVAGAVTVTLDPRVEIRVEVFGPDGRPAAGVPVSAFAGGSNGYSSVVCTDRGGRARVWTRRAKQLEVRALAAAAKPIAVAVPNGYFDRKVQLLRLDLPPLGRVHATGSFGADCELSLSGGGLEVPPIRIDDYGAWFGHVALEGRLTARLRQRFCEAVKLEAGGPSKSGEIVTIDFRGLVGAAATRLLKGVLLEADGKPVVSSRLWACVLREDQGPVFVEATADDGGRFAVEVETRRLMDGEAQFVLAPRPHLVSGDTPIAIAAVTVGGEGAIELGELRLQEEPVLAQGRVVDVHGKPVAGVDVVVRQVVGPRMSTRLPWWETRSAMDGTFTLRGFDPRRGELRIGVDGKDVLADDVATAYGGTGVELRVARPGSVEVTCVDGYVPSWLRIELRKAGEPGGEHPYRGSVFPKIRPGRYDVVMSYLERPVLRIDGIEVRSGETCDDPRIRGIDWRLYVSEVGVVLQDAAGAPLKGRVVVTSGDGGERDSLDTDERGYVRVPLLDGLAMTAFASDFRPVRVPMGFDPIQVRLVPRARLRVSIPQDADVPDTLVVREGGTELADDVIDGAELRPAGNGTVTLVFGERVLRGGVKFRELWRQDVRLRDDDLLQVLTVDVR